MINMKIIVIRILFHKLLNVMFQYVFVVLPNAT